MGSRRVEIVFTGEFRHSVDEKGRLVLPAKTRVPLAAGLVVTKGQERCLFVFTMERWDKEVEQVTSRPRSTQRNRNYARSFFGGASDQQLDKQGRLVVPANLREYAGIDRDVVILGVGDHLEVWAADSWDTMSSAADQSFSDLEEDESWDGK